MSVLPLKADILKVGMLVLVTMPADALPEPLKMGALSRRVSHRF
jgi:hypothetical protein